MSQKQFWGVGTGVSHQKKKYNIGQIFSFFPGSERQLKFGKVKYRFNIMIPTGSRERDFPFPGAMETELDLGKDDNYTMTSKWLQRAEAGLAISGLDNIMVGGS